jgi:ferredoxin-NADP reductase
LLHLAPGSTLDASGPHGAFVLRDDHRPLVLVAGGIGITPFRSMLSELFASLDPRNITLLYSNATPDIPFRSFLDHLASCWPKLRVVYTVTRPSAGWDGPTGRIDAAFIRHNVPATHGAIFYVCGPTGLVDSIRSLLIMSGVDARQIVDEAFPGYPSHEPAEALSSR